MAVSRSEILFQNLEQQRVRLDTLGQRGFTNGRVDLGVFRVGSQDFRAIIDRVTYQARLVEAENQPLLTTDAQNRVVAVGRVEKDPTKFIPIPYRRDLESLPVRVARGLVDHLTRI